MTNTVSKLSAITLAGVLAAATFSLYTLEASAYYFGGGDDDRTVVRTDNSASVQNQAHVSANTGGNIADGGEGGRGGDGGNARGGDGGNGARAGYGGDGGAITTGAATAIGTINNDVNSTNVRVEGCGCDDDQQMSRYSYFNTDYSLTRVDTNNQAQVSNSLAVDSNTGHNYADGGEGGNGGDGGNARGNRSWLAWFWLNQGGDAGDAGNGKHGGDAGTIRTGVAISDGLITNVVNRNVVRIENGDEEVVPVI